MNEIAKMFGVPIERCIIAIGSQSAQSKENRPISIRQSSPTPVVVESEYHDRDGHQDIQMLLRFYGLEDTSVGRGWSE